MLLNKKIPWENLEISFFSVQPSKRTLGNLASQDFAG